MGDDYRENLYVKQSIIQDIIDLLQSLLYLLKQIGVIARSVTFRIVGNDVKAHDRGVNDGRILPDLCRKDKVAIMTTQVLLHELVKTPSCMVSCDDYAIYVKYRIEARADNLSHLDQLKQSFRSMASHDMGTMIDVAAVKALTVMIPI